jgi:hypothetical protein
MNAPNTKSLPFMLSGAVAVNPEATVDTLKMVSQGVQFMSMRLGETLKTQGDLLECKSPADVWAVQSEYLQTAVQQYTMAGQGMLELWGDAMRDGMKLASRKYDDVPV